MGSSFVYETPHLLYWDWRIAADLFFGGIGVGAFLVAALCSLYYRNRYPAITRIGAVIAPLSVILGDCFLLSEVGQPLRIWRTATGFNVSSPLSWGGPFQALFILVALAYAFVWLRRKETRLRTVLAVLGIPLAVIVGGYHGWLLSIVKARPLWNSGPGTVAALVGFATTGMAAVLLGLCASRKARQAESAQAGGASAGAESHPISDFRNVLVAALILQCLTFFVWWIGLVYGLADGRAALAKANAALGPLFWAVGIGIGLVIPALIQSVEALRQRRTGHVMNVPLATLSALLILVGGFVFRYAVVVGGQLS